MDYLEFFGNLHSEMPVERKPEKENVMHLRECSARWVMKRMYYTINQMPV